MDSRARNSTQPRCTQASMTVGTPASIRNIVVEAKFLAEVKFPARYALFLGGGL